MSDAARIESAYNRAAMADGTATALHAALLGGISVGPELRWAMMALTEQTRELRDTLEELTEEFFARLGRRLEGEGTGDGTQK